jgi:hypothetical protein
MPAFTSALPAALKPDDVSAFIQTLPEVPRESPMGVVVDGVKIRSVEIEGITQQAFDSVMTKVQAQFPAAF